MPTQFYYPRQVEKALLVTVDFHQKNQWPVEEITRELVINDHTKVVFHLKILKEAGLIDQNKGKAYFLSKEGMRMIECLKTLEQYLTP